MKKLIESTLVSLDGIVDGQEKWTAGYFDEEAKAHAYETLANVDVFLLGRGTFEKFSPTWPNIQGDRYFDRINSLKKFVVSSTLDPAGAWNATAIKGNVGAEIARLKNEPGKNIMKYGTTRLDRTLFDLGLVDELHLWCFPVVVGHGRRLFEDVDTSRLHLELTDIHRFKSGSVKHTYAVRPKQD
ncbi:dihydrofolate reductase family protein [Dyella sp. 2HG41-7]|uniref:dihydrofolate reductase family protein n=1 Tax=Dyella sp. 2HG41-7 TaxID=2883239 RepID=UPI001F307C1B|nr:dihydrofolate reductase family protein [Dyella sp. 2HG41-7]